MLEPSKSGASVEVPVGLSVGVALGRGLGVDEGEAVNVNVGVAEAVGVEVGVADDVGDGVALGRVLTPNVPARTVAKTKQAMAASRQRRRIQSVSLFK
ncbi:MAG TPA: hypothetical protein VFH29_09905 [Anaerolineales bacterium]|nr:hypothetical protein [Anaerolineales bacterium]